METLRWHVTARRIIYLLLAVLAVLLVLLSGAIYRHLAFRATGRVTLDGNVFYLDPDDKVMTRKILRWGTWEPVETRLLLEELRPGDSFVDVGASFGYYTVLGSRRVGPDGTVLAFE